jgi:hypothetical protein
MTEPPAEKQPVPEAIALMGNDCCRNSPSEGINPPAKLARLRFPRLLEALEGGENWGSQPNAVPRPTQAIEHHPTRQITCVPVGHPSLSA